MKGINFFNELDEKILLAIADGKFTINGFRSKNLKKDFSDLPAWKISNILKRLKILGLIRKVSNSYKYYITSLGRKTITTGLYLKNQIIIPSLAIA